MTGNIYGDFGNSYHSHNDHKALGRLDFWKTFLLARLAARAATSNVTLAPLA